MASKRWTTDAELKFLESQYQSYIDHKAKKELPHFWKPVSFEFFKQFSEKEQLFGSEAVTLTPEQITELTNVTARRREQIINWFHNEGNRGHHRARDAAKIKGLNLSLLSKLAGCHRLQPVEVYSRKYYDAKIKPLVAAEIERDGLGKKQTLAVIKRVTREVFEKESEEVKAQIQAEIDAAEDADARMADSEPSPLQCQFTLNNAPTVLREFLCELSRKTGWCFTVFRGGPALQEWGELRTISIHEGKTLSGLTFADLIDIKVHCIKPFTEFVAAIYPKEVHASYAIEAPQRTASSDPKPSDGLSSEYEPQSASSAELGESSSPRWDMRHSSLPSSSHLNSLSSHHSSLASSLHLNSASHLSDCINFHSDGDHAGLMLNISGRLPMLSAGSSGHMATAGLGRERAATEELLPEADGNSNAIMDPFSFNIAQLEQTDFMSIVLSLQSLSLLDDFCPDSEHPLDFSLNVTQNGIVRSGTLPSADASFRLGIAPSASSRTLPSEPLTPAPPALIISALPASVISAPPAVFASVASETELFLPVSTPTTSVGTRSHPA